jgi:hypothetical protein
MAQAKLGAVKQQIEDLLAMRNQLEQILKDWDARLAHTRKGKPARLLETLPNELARVSSLSSLAAKQRKERRI